MADLGDSVDQAAQKYTALPRDPNSDVIGKDGLLHSLDTIWTYYWDRDGHGVGHVYSAKGVAVAVAYTARKGELSRIDVTKFLELNKLPDLDKSYWTRTQREPGSATIGGYPRMENTGSGYSTVMSMRPRNYTRF